MSKRINRTISSTTLMKYEKLSSILKYIFVDVCNIDQSKYYLLGSFALREHRNINDIDINLHKDEFMKLEKAVDKGFGRLEFYNGQIRWILDLTKLYNKLTGEKEDDFSIEAFMKEPNVGYPNSNFSLSKLIAKKGLTYDKNGHQFLTLPSLLKWKKTMNRAKDQKDIQLIKTLYKPSL